MPKSVAVWYMDRWTMDCPHCGCFNTITPKGDECPDLVAGPEEKLFGKVECGRCKESSMTLFWNPRRKSKSP